MAISAKIIADSLNPIGNNRCTSFVCTFPRIILAEAKTHRMISDGVTVDIFDSGVNDCTDLSRNSASSRAIPFQTMLKKVKEEFFIPIAWQKDHKGMQGTEYFTDELMEGPQWKIGNRVITVREALNNQWLKGRELAVDTAEWMHRHGVTKQLCNRLLEPYMYHTAIITATEYDNWFKLRCPQYEYINPINGEISYVKSKKNWLVKNECENHIPNILSKTTDIDWLTINKGQGEIHIMALAEAMWDAMNESTPKTLQPGEWHIPFGDTIDRERVWDAIDTIYPDRDVPSLRLADEDTSMMIKIATARCARVSYINYEGKDDYIADLKLYDGLIKNGHASPLEHCARAMNQEEYYSNLKGKLEIEEFINPDDTILDTFYKGITEGDPIAGWCNNFRGFIQQRYLIENKNG